MSSKIYVSGIVRHFIEIQTKSGNKNVLLFLSNKQQNGSYQNVSVRLVGPAAVRFLNQLTIENIKDGNNFYVFTSDRTDINTQQIEAVRIDNKEEMGKPFRSHLMGITAFEYELKAYESRQNRLDPESDKTFDDEGLTQEQIMEQMQAQIDLQRFEQESREKMIREHIQSKLHPKIDKKDGDLAF